MEKKGPRKGKGGIKLDPGVSWRERAEPQSGLGKARFSVALFLSFS